MRPALPGAQLVEHAVLRHLEQPRRELAAQREARQALEDAHEDLLRQILGERPVAGQTQDVVEDRRLVHADDDRERTLVASLGLSEDRELRLRKRHGAASIAPHIGCFGAPARTYRGFTRAYRSSPWAAPMPRSASTVGARSRISPPAASSAPARVQDARARDSSCARCAGAPSAVELFSALPWSAVTRHAPPSASTRLDDPAEAASVGLDRLHDCRDRRRCARPCRGWRS